MYIIIYLYIIIYNTSTSWATADIEGRVYTHIQRAVELVLLEFRSNVSTASAAPCTT